jgi:OmpA-OmpF porin, OOP family
MKKICILVALLMMMFSFKAVNVEARAGGLPDLTVDKAIKDCSCPPCCSEATPTPEKATVRLNIRFDTGKAVVKEQYRKDIQSIANLLKYYPDAKAKIEGHTDNVGNDDYNQKLSEERAKSVRQYLIDKFDIDGSRLTAVGYGKSKPLASNDTEKGRQINRRVQAVFNVTMTRIKTIINVK